MGLFFLEGGDDSEGGGPTELLPSDFAPEDGPCEFNSNGALVIGADSGGLSPQEMLGSQGYGGPSVNRDVYIPRSVRKAAPPPKPAPAPAPAPAPPPPVSPPSPEPPLAPLYPPDPTEADAIIAGVGAENLGPLQHALEFASGFALPFDSALGLLGDAAEETTTLYRAVSQAEYADIMETGVLRAGPNSYATGKFFAESGEHAIQWGNALEGAGNFRVIQADFPTSIADQFMRWERLDGIGPARFGTFEQLGQPTISLWPGSP